MLACPVEFDRRTWMNRFLSLIAAVLMAWTAGEAVAQADAARGFPQRSVRIIVPFGAGGGTDSVARFIAMKMSESFGQSVIVENKPGAQGIIACEFVQKAAPDGYTILIATSGPMAANAAIYPKLPYQPLRDFAPVTMIGTYPLILVVNSSLQVKSLQELIEYARARPNKVNYGTSGALGQLVSELFNQRTGTRFQYIPYKSSGDFVGAVLSNEVTMALSDTPPVTGLVRAEKLRALAITSASRHHAWPDVPTMAEAGVPDFVVEFWNGFFVPVRTPAPIVHRLHEEFARVAALPDVRERLNGLGVDPSAIPGEEFAKIVATDIARWTAVARAANIKAD
jgi:tripartite-type tricarboxylate transporter receptor subunit TctC